MRTPMIAAASLIALTALPAAAQAQDYRAFGSKPSWRLTIGERVMRFETAGRRPVTVPTPRVIHGFAGEMWQGRRIDVNTVHRGCSDGVSDRSWSDTVTVRVDGRTYRGCGGEASLPVPQTSAIEGGWRIEAIDGRPVVRGTDPSVHFEQGRISGNASCNRFSGSFGFERGRLSAGALATTRMACMERARNVQETTILALFRERLTVSANGRGKLVLTAPGGRTLTLVRAAER